MAYSSGGLIAASDYNGFVGTATQSGTINYVWSTGNGSTGYGQSALSQAASSGGTVTAAQWATAINTLNSISTHQSGSGTGIGAPTAGGLIAYLSTFGSSISTVNTNHLNFNSQGATTTGTVYSPNFTAANGASAQTFTITRTVTFASGDAARYFFNAGGQLNFFITSVTVGDGTSRSTDLQTLLATNFSTLAAFRATTNSGRGGTGGTVNTNNTSFGYYNLTTTAQNIVQITSTTSGYTGDYVILAAQSNGAQGSNADTGSVITFTVTIYSAARTDPTLGAQFNDSINITPNHRIDIVYPETTNLTSSWGTPTIA